MFQNLRASRATELANEYAAHVAAAWLGHSTAIASKHYWRVTDDDYEKAAQNAAQQAHAESRNDSQDDGSAHKKTSDLRQPATLCEAVQPEGMGDTGFEPVTSAV